MEAETSLPDSAHAAEHRDVLVLEESERPGGRIRSVRREDTWLNFGAHTQLPPRG